eukprot:172975-Hanusia_phi.AAC.5
MLVPTAAVTEQKLGPAHAQRASTWRCQTSLVVQEASQVELVGHHLDVPHEVLIDEACPGR